MTLLVSEEYSLHIGLKGNEFLSYPILTFGELIFLKYRTMKYVITTILFFAFTFLSFSQNSRPTKQSNSSLDFGTFLRGIKLAEIATSPEQEKFMQENPSSAALFLGVVSFLQGIGFEEVGFSSKFRGVPVLSECDKTIVLIRYEVKGDFITDFSITFVTCNNDYFHFAKDRPIKIGYSDLTTKIHNACIELYGYKKNTYNSSYRLKLKGEISAYNEKNLMEYFSSGKLEAFEGVYENVTTGNKQAKYKVGLRKTISGYDLIYISGAQNYLDWNDGDIKAKLYPTATPTLFKADWYMANKFKNTDYLITFDQGLMNVLDETKEKNTYIKLYPQASTNTGNSPGTNSGTGFAISANGYIVTNHHVVEGAKLIKVKGINNNFSKSYKAEIVTADKNNDLAIIKITDLSFTSLGMVPFTITKSSSDVGTSIFVLGYPLRATMGDEVKLTNGIISSKSGFQGDITSYQISAPVQPGNSGGPLFDQSGNIIGVINAKHVGAENVSYAIKSTYLNNLIEQLPISLQLSSTLLKDKSLSEQVKIAKSFVYILDIE